MTAMSCLMMLTILGTLAFMNWWLKTLEISFLLFFHSYRSLKTTPLPSTLFKLALKLTSFS